MSRRTYARSLLFALLDVFTFLNYNRTMNPRAWDWLRQAEDDLLWARDTLKAGRYSQTCFAAQQVAEKALKALAFKKGYTEIRSHSILEITHALKINDEIENMGKRLDQYYISTRYPDAFPAGAPFEYFTEDQAQEAVDFAEKIVNHAKSFFSPNKGEE